MRLRPQLLLASSASFLTSSYTTMHTTDWAATAATADQKRESTCKLFLAEAQTGGCS